MHSSKNEEERPAAKLWPESRFVLFEDLVCNSSGLIGAYLRRQSIKFAYHRAQIRRVVRALHRDLDSQGAAEHDRLENNEWRREVTERNARSARSYSSGPQPEDMP